MQCVAKSGILFASGDQHTEQKQLVIERQTLERVERIIRGLNASPNVHLRMPGRNCHLRFEFLDERIVSLLT
jgi:hypothetical protein